MNILVIGNGFDLAHGLPTKYTDFLKFCEMIKKIYESEKLDAGHYEMICLDRCNLNEEIKQQLLTVFASRKDSIDITDDSKIIHTFTTDYPRSDELYALIKDNLWIHYFLQCNMHGKENWIDFESEISGVIQSLDDDMHGLSQVYNIEDIVYDLSNEFLKKKYSDYIIAARQINPVDNGFSEGISFKEIRNKLLADLNKLIRAFEIYLTDYVERIDCKLISPDIQRILPKESAKVNRIPVYDVHVLSFNYTNTYQRLYIDKVQDNKYFENYIDYIHGKANINNSMESNNMVLGIDEYLPKKRKNKDIEFIVFKKFYQRILKQTGCKYKNWVEILDRELKAYQRELGKIKDDMLYNEHVRDLKKKYLGKHKLYIFGHSLDVTDKDILRDLILNDNVDTTIFYHDKDTMGKQIANLVKVIGQDELIRRTGGSTKTIEFKLLKPMEESKRQITRLGKLAFL